MDKPAGATSHDVVAIVRRRLGCRAIGHTGTLDPFATGLLVLVVGGATRLARFVSPGSKRYRATIRLGVTTTTDDLTGEPTGPGYQGEWPSADRVEEAIGALVGLVQQRPPAFSAKLVAGVRSYRLARKGRAVDLETATVRIDRVTVTRYQPPDLEFEAVVGPGAYIRSLGRDWGDRLGTGGHLTALRREAVGPFEVSAAVSPDAVDPSTTLIEPADLLTEMPRVAVSVEEAALLRHGRAVGTAGSDRGPVALMSGGELIAIGEFQADRWQPVIVLGTQ